jgi:predicted permease
MTAFLLLVLCLALGALMARTLRLPQGLAPSINFWVLYVALPALVLDQIPQLHIDATLAFPALAPLIPIGGALLLFPLLGRAFGWSRGSVGALILTCGLGNTAFMGLAMVEALLGHAALGPALIADQLGTFLSLSTIGVSVAAIYSGDTLRPAEIGRRILRFPPFLALIAAFAIRWLGGWPEVFEPVLKRLGDTLTPLALFSVGLQFKLADIGSNRGKLFAGLGWKLVLSPAIAVAIALISGVRGVAVYAGILQTAMAPMITAGILAVEHDLDPPLANLVVSLGILLSLLSVPLLAHFL